MPAHHLEFAEVIALYRRGSWGFTGTRAGMSVPQHDWCKRLLSDGHPSIFRHGGAYGADTQIHAIRRDSKFAGVTHVWPADPKRRAMFLNQRDVKVEDVMDPLIRNEEIVRRSTFMIAAPHTQYEIIRSGTWHTIRCAIRHGKPTLILWPNGDLTLHRDNVLYRVVLNSQGSHAESRHQS
jgi:hypothetical protein